MMIQTNKKLLIEIGTYDLPSKLLHSYTKKLTINLKKNLKKKNIKFEKITSFSTLRRFIFLINIEKFNDDHIKEIIEKLIKNTTFETNMKWKNNNDKFIRPITSYSLIHGTRLINHKIFNIKSSLYSKNNFLLDKVIKINANDYEKILTKNKIIIDNKKRVDIIKKEILKIAKKKKVKILLNKESLKNISNSVEYPRVIISSFKNKFLKLPEKIIEYNLSEKNCIPLIKKNIISNFIIITDGYIKKINNIKNEYKKCINFKLAESEYFNNKSKNLIKKYSFKDIIFHKKIGNLHEKIKRIFFLIKNIKLNNKIKIMKLIVLSKLDSQTKIVTEIPNMKAIISANKKINLERSKILYDYNNTVNNSIPKLEISSIITILDNIDNIVGFFSIGEKAKNKKDPFNLRRDVITILKIIIKNKINININEILNLSLESYKIKDNKQIKNELTNFFYDRLKFYTKNKDIKNIKEKNIYKIYLISKILLNFKYYKFNEDLKNIIKRIFKIIIKNPIDLKIKYNRKIDPKNIKNKLINKILKEIKILKILKKGNLYFEYTKTIINLNKIINLFFNKILILDENKAIKINNLKILNILDKYINNLINFKNIL